jgi:hypothetical protein
MLYLSCGEGFIEVLKQNDPDNYTEIEKIPTAQDARTSLWIKEQDYYYWQFQKGIIMMHQSWSMK